MTSRMRKRKRGREAGMVRVSTGKIMRANWARIFSTLTTSWSESLSFLWPALPSDRYRVTSDYASNAGLDTYSEAGLDDRSSIPEMSRQQRLAAERAMERRDRGLPGARAARRSRAPAFLQSDDEEDTGVGHGLLDGISTRRRRRQYDERPDQDDVEGDEVS